MGKGTTLRGIIVVDRGSMGLPFLKRALLTNVAATKSSISGDMAAPQVDSVVADNEQDSIREECEELIACDEVHPVRSRYPFTVYNFECALQSGPTLTSAPLFVSGISWISVIKRALCRRMGRQPPLGSNDFQIS